MRYLFLLIINITHFNSFAQSVDGNNLLKDNKRPKVLLLGTFHFENPNLDTYKSDNAINILDRQKQIEIIEVVDKIKKFKPTIICLEETDNETINKNYSEYINLKRTLSKNEGEQLGFRIAKAQNLKRIFAVDATSYLRDNIKRDKSLSNIWDDEFYLDTAEADKWSEKYYHWYSYLEKKLLESSILEYLRLLNQPENLKYNLGQYLVENKTSNNNGPDFIALDWYDRNLRIYNNILKTNPTDEDRILVVIGSGHIPILQHLFDSSPQFELLNILDFLR